MATQRTKAGAPSLVNVASISLRWGDRPGGTDDRHHLPDHDDRHSRPKRLIVADCGLGTHFVEGVREGQEIAAHYHALAQLSTPELARHGLNRQMIARAALTGF